MEWNRRNIVVAVVILLIGFGGGGAVYIEREGGIEFALFRLEKWATKLYSGSAKKTPEALAKEQKQAEKIVELAYHKYPDLRIEDRPVPRERNGFYAMLELAEDPRMADLKQIESHRLLNLEFYGRSEDEGTIAEELRLNLVEFEELGEEIERVAAMPERSSSDFPASFKGMVPGSEIKTMSDYLLVKAVLSAGNEDEAFRYVSLALKLSDHLHRIEEPNLLSETIVILIRLSASGTVFERILPKLGRSADLEKWRQVIEPCSDVPQRHARVLRGELAYFSRNFAGLLFGEVPDVEETVLAHHAWVQANLIELEKMDFEEFSRFKAIPHQSFTKDISREGVSIIDMCFSQDAWTKGLVRSHVVELYHAAAMDLLIREKAGEDLSKLTETYLLNPVTKLPFKFDPTTRSMAELSEGEGGLVESLKLPW